MELHETITSLGDLFLILAIVPLSVFVFMYITRSKWYKTELGIALLFQKLALGFLLLQEFVKDLVPPEFTTAAYSFRLLVLVTVFTFFCVDVYNLHRYQSVPSVKKK